MKRVLVIDQLQQDVDATAVASLGAATALAGFTADDVTALADAVDAREVQVVLLEVDAGPDQGSRYWILERPGAFPPVNWTLAEWRSRQHSAPCGACGHQSEDQHTGCDCACHSIFGVLLNMPDC